jgi:hypothetical protein
MSDASLSSVVVINEATKARLDKHLAAGQCCDDFLWQLLDIWDKMHSKHRSEETDIS